MGDISSPTIPVSESAEVSETFLPLIYQIEGPTIYTLQLVDDFL